VLQVVSWVDVVERKIKIWENLRQENNRLRKQNLKLSLENQHLREVLIENMRLRRLLQFKREYPLEVKSARVIGFGQESAVRSVILDLGEADGIHKNMAVVTDQGLVGRIFIAEKHQSIAQILLDRNSLVSARLQSSREVGTIVWRGNVWLDLLYIPKDVEVEQGEVVITSGLSQIYPPGLKIGVVAEVEQSDYELFKKIKVRPAVNFNRLEEVFIIVPTDSLKKESLKIE